MSVVLHYAIFVKFQLKPNQLNDNAFWMKINETEFETPDLLIDLEKTFSTGRGTPYTGALPYIKHHMLFIIVYHCYS